MINGHSTLQICSNRRKAIASLQHEATDKLLKSLSANESCLKTIDALAISRAECVEMALVLELRPALYEGFSIEARRINEIAMRAGQGLAIIKPAALGTSRSIATLSQSLRGEGTTAPPREASASGGRGCRAVSRSTVDQGLPGEPGACGAAGSEMTSASGGSIPSRASAV